MSEIDDLLEAAMMKEVASQSFYLAEEKSSGDPGVAALMKDLAAEESKHLEWLRRIKDKGIKNGKFYPKKAADLKLSSYLAGGYILENAGLQEALTFAIKRELQAIDFYNNMMSVLKDQSAKRLARRLVQAELGHKFKLETMYDSMYYKEF
jgi:rubrerythrin